MQRLKSHCLVVSSSAVQFLFLLITETDVNAYFNMPRTYIKKKRTTYTLETLKKAVADVKNGTLNAYQASKKYGIPRMTIVDHSGGVIKDTKGRPLRIDSSNEQRLANGLRTMEKYGFVLSSKETTVVVTQFIKTNKIKTDFKNDTPGYDWFAGFLKRNNLSLKKPQAVEMSRKAACDPFIIKDYFDTLESVIKELNLESNPEKIWNLDESGFSKDPEKTRVVGARGYASTRTIASTGKDNITVLFTANAFGEKLPPLIIFKGKNVWDTWMSHKAFEDTSYAATKNGWIESKVFEKYMLNTVLPHISKEPPALLIYDGHSTHIQLTILEKAAQMGVTIIKLLSHASHLLQPLDLAVFKSMKDKWDAKILAWQRLNIGAKLQKDEFSQIMGEVWKDLDPKIIRNGFRKGGVYPLNKNVIPEDKYDPETLKKYLCTKYQKSQDVPSLSTLCMKILNRDSYAIKPKVKPFLNPCEINIPGTSAGTAGIQILENREVSLENLLLNTIKKSSSQTTIKIKKKIAAKGCDVITKEYFFVKVANGRGRKTKKRRRKEIKTNPEKDKKYKETTKKTTYSSEESLDDSELVPSDSSHEDWSNFCDKIYGDDQENSSSDHDISKSEVNESPSLSHKHFSHNITDYIQDEYDSDPNRRSPQVDDWLLVKFLTKRSVKYFVGNVISMIENKPNVKYLRIIKNSKVQSFHYPDVEDVSVIRHDSDIVMFLDKPEITRRGRIIFKENFRSFNIQ